MSLEGILLALLLVLGGLLLVILFLWLTRRACGRNQPPLQPHYLRLGRSAPDDACPCGRAGAAPRPYRECCRRADVNALAEEVREFLWKHWSHRSFAGRRRSRSMINRLEDFPLPPFVLPDWVERPEKFTFPISEEELRAWSPLSRKPTVHRQPDIEEASGPGDLF